MVKILRRAVMVAVALALTALALFIYVYRIEPGLILKSTLPAPRFFTAASPRVVFFSDLHISGSYSMKLAAKTVKLINSLSPDIVLFGGDLCDNYRRDQKSLDLKALGELLKSINAAEKYAVYGNHDYGGGAVRVYAGIMESGGFKVLRNSTEMSAFGFPVTGLDDFMLGRNKPTDCPLPSSAGIILSHAPDVSDRLTPASGSLILSGHTHGGQVALPFITRRIALPPGGRKYVSGEFSLRNGASLFVSRGIGTTALPFRFLSPPDILVINAVGE